MISVATDVKVEKDKIVRLLRCRDQLTEYDRDAGRSWMKRENRTGPRTDHFGTSQQTWKE